MINFEVIEDEFGEDWEIFQEIFNEYTESYEEMFKEINGYISSLSYQDVYKTCHTLKGIIANFYSEAMTTAVVNLEMAAGEEDLSCGDELFNDILNENLSMITQIKDYDKKR